MNSDLKAPVLILTHTRLYHLQKCVNSLLQCVEAKETELFISSDFYRNENEKNKVIKVRQYIESIKGFKKVTPILFNNNIGGSKAFRFCKVKVFEKNESILLLEDDIQVSPFFLKYMNEGLNFYKNDPNVFSISGFSPFSLGNNYFEHNYIFKFNGFNGWGVGLWKTKLNSFLNFRDSSELFSDIKLNLGSRTFRKKLDNLSLEHYPHLLNSKKQKIIPEFDYLAGYYCLKNNFFNIMTTQSFTINTGNDGSGLRAKNNNDITLKMNVEALTNEIPEFKKLNDLKLEEKPQFYSANRLIIFLKILLIKFRLFKVGKNIHNIFYEFKNKFK